MKINYLLFIMILSVSCFGQNQPSKKEHQKVKAGFGVSVSQTQPEFPGGTDSLNNYLRSNIKYPHDSKMNGIHGRVYIGFLIDKMGKMRNVRVLSGVTDELNQEALRVVNSMPDWKPGTSAGNPLDVQYILPIDFVLPPKQERQQE